MPARRGPAQPRVLPLTPRPCVEMAASDLAERIPAASAETRASLEASRREYGRDFG